MFSDDKEYIYKHSVEFREKIKEKIEEGGLDGLCVAWTIDWIKQNIMGTPTNEIYSFEQIDQLVKKHKKYIEGREMERYCEKEGVSMNKIREGDISYHGGLKEISNLKLEKDHAYLVEIAEPRSGMNDTGGHVFGLFQKHDALLFFDQNFGLVCVPSLDRIAEEYMKEVQLFEDKLEIKLRSWAIFEVALVKQ